MRITKLILKHFKPFLLNSFTYFEYNPNERYQLITGVNGSGKSSLLRELSPLPSDGNLFTKGGKKEIWIEKDNNQYQLINDYSQSRTGKHYFFLNGVDLNDSNNVTLQKQLVWDHFKYDNELHQLLIDETRWTELTPIKRRDWFVRLANCNMEYAIGVYNKIKSDARDVVGGIRTTEENLVKKSANLLPQATIDQYQTQMTELTSNIHELDELIDKNVVTVTKLEEPIRRVVDVLNQKMSILDEWDKYPVKHKCQSLTQMKEVFSNINHESQLLIKSVEELKTKYDEVEQLTDKTKWSGNFTDEEVEQKFKETEAVWNRVKDNLIPEYIHHEDIQEKFEEIKYVFPDWAVGAPTNKDGQYNRNNFHEKKERLRSLEQQVINLQNKKRDLLHRLEHIQNHPTTECPQCQHVWKVGVNVNDEPRLKKEIETIDQQLTNIQKEDIEPIQEWMTEAERVREDRLYFREHFMSKYSIFQRFWSSLLDYEDFLYTPSKYANETGKLERQIRLHLEAKDAQKAYQEASMMYTERMKQKGNQSLFGSLQTLREEYESQTHKLLKLQHHKKSFEKDLNTQMTRQSELDTIVNVVLDKFDKLLLSYEDALANDILLSVRDEVYAQLAVVKAELDQVKTQQTVIEQLKDQIAYLKRQEERYKRLISVLNPQDGLIAKSLLGFIKTFVSQVNNVIEHVWTYPMAIFIDDESDFTSDYKFPLDIAGRNRVPDISQGSRGQQEFINFAFRLLVMKYLGIIDYPILADELGTSFNEEHRLNTFDYIKQLIETGQIEQLFLISHNPTTHDVFNVVDRIHLDPDRKQQSEVIIME